MTPSKRIIVNTAAQYIRTILNVCLSLYSTRLILSALGQSDYGIYSVVAGVVAMLSFITNALVTTTQRYISYYHGKDDYQKVYSIFGNSMLLHIFIGITISIILLIISPYVTYDFLNIAPGRREAALIVYIAAVVMLLLSFLTAPIRALFIARENIVYISIIDVLDGVLKLLLALLLPHLMFDHLASYGTLMTYISIFNLLAFSIYAIRHFPECHLPHLKEWNKDYIKDLSSFAGWTVYSTGCIVARNQGIAILYNLFVGTIANAAYGIALQVSSAISFVAVSILNAINPQIMKAEGAGDRDKMFLLSEYESKYSFLLLSIVTIPLIIEMNTILCLWLGDVPSHTVEFCRYILIAALCDQMSIGLTTVNQAIGNIRNYSLMIYTIKLLTIPLAWICLKMGLALVAPLGCYILFEIITSILRIPFLSRTAGLNYKSFLKHTILLGIFPTLMMIIAGCGVVYFINSPYRFLLTIVIVVSVGCLSIWLTALNNQEKNIIKQLMREKL